MNKQILKRYYKNARSSLINSYVILNNELYITNGTSIISLKEPLKNGIQMDSLNYSINKYIDNFKKYNFRALDLDNYYKTCDLISFIKDKEYIKNNQYYNIGGNYEIDLKQLKNVCDLIHASTVSIMDSQNKNENPIVFFKNKKNNAHGWLLPCKVY